MSVSISYVFIPICAQVGLDKSSIQPVARWRWPPKLPSHYANTHNVFHTVCQLDQSVISFHHSQLSSGNALTHLSEILRRLDFYAHAWEQSMWFIIHRKQAFFTDFPHPLLSLRLRLTAFLTHAEGTVLYIPTYPRRTKSREGEALFLQYGFLWHA